MGWGGVGTVSWEEWGGWDGHTKEAARVGMHINAVAGKTLGRASVEMGEEEKCLGEIRSKSMKWVRAPKENLRGVRAGWGAVRGLCRVRAPPPAGPPSGGRLQGGLKRFRCSAKANW